MECESKLLGIFCVLYFCGCGKEGMVSILLVVDGRIVVVFNIIICMEIY